MNARDHNQLRGRVYPALAITCFILAGAITLAAILFAGLLTVVTMVAAVNSVIFCGAGVYLLRRRKRPAHPPAPPTSLVTWFFFFLFVWQLPFLFLMAVPAFPVMKIMPWFFFGAPVLAALSTWLAKRFQLSRRIKF